MLQFSSSPPKENVTSRCRRRTRALLRVVHSDKTAVMAQLVGSRASLGLRNITYHKRATVTASPRSPRICLVLRI